jgi:hypothetical protein
MDKIIVYLDDAAHALQQLTPMAIGSRAAGGPSHSAQWILVACPPRMTRHISRWVTHSAREVWRNKWSDEQFAQITPVLTACGGTVSTVVATGRLVAHTERLLAIHKNARVLDARRARFGQDVEPITRNQPTAQASRWQVPGALAGMGTLMVLASD